MSSDGENDSEFERGLRDVLARAAGESEGIFGPGSVSWKVDREAMLFLGAGRALLLQLAHPWVAQAVTDHSTALADPIARFHRTFDLMFTLVFGSLDQALAAARRLHRRHASVTGTMASDAGPFAAGSIYQANERAALLWVHATLVDTSLVVHETILGPLEPDERDRYYEESKLMAAMYGIPREMVPPTWGRFREYFEAQLNSSVLTVTPEAQAIANRLLIEGASFWLRPPRWYGALTASMLPERLCAAYRLTTDEARAHAAVRRIRWAYPALPQRLRHVGPYWEASERLAGRGPRALTQLSNRAWIGRRTLERATRPRAIPPARQGENT